MHRIGRPIESLNVFHAACVGQAQVSAHNLLESHLGLKLKSRCENMIDHENGPEKITQLGFTLAY